MYPPWRMLLPAELKYWLRLLKPWNLVASEPHGIEMVLPSRSLRPSGSLKVVSVPMGGTAVPAEAGAGTTEISICWIRLKSRGFILVNWVYRCDPSAHV